MKLLLFALAAAALLKKSNPGIGNIDDDFSELTTCTNPIFSLTLQ